MTMICTIRVRGQLDESWVSWFEGLTVTNVDNGCAQVEGGVPDMAAFYGVLAKMRDLGLPLVFVCLEDTEAGIRGP